MKKAMPLDQAVRLNLQAYLDDMGELEPIGMWDMVMTCVEKPLLETVMAHANGNQSRAAKLLGVTRNTLRKKLQEHQLLDC